MLNDTESASKTVGLSDSVHSIFRSAARFFSGTVLSRISGLVRDVSLAYAFGTDASLACFFVAFRFSQSLRRLFGEGALQSAFVPLFETIRKDSSTKAFQFFRDLNALWAIVLSLFILVGMGGVFSYLKIFNEGSSSHELLYLTALMLPSLLPTCLFGLNASLLQCEKYFFTVGFAPVAFNCIFALSAFLLKNVAPIEAMPYLAYAVVLACTVQWLFTLVPALRISAMHFKNGFFEKIQLFSKEIQNLWKPLSLGMLGVGASQINNTVDALFAFASDPEAPAQLWFSSRLQQLPLALFGIALSSALLPPLSRAVQAGDKKQFLSFFEFSIRRTFTFLMPCTIYLLVLGMNSIHCLFGRGDFQTHSVLTTTCCLQGYAFALVPMGLVLIFAPAFYAKKEYMIPARGACIALIVNTLFDALFIYVFGLKAVAITLATNIAFWMNVWYLSYNIRKEWGSVMTHEGYTSFFKITLCSIGAGLCCFLFLGAFQGFPSLFGLFQETAFHLPETLYERISTLTAASIVFAGSLFAFARLIDASDLLSLIKGKKI